MAQIRVKNYSSASVAAFIQDFMPEALVYLRDNGLTSAVFGGTITSMTQYCAVVSKYSGGNFVSASLTVGSSTYVCQYNGNNSTLTYNELALKSDLFPVFGSSIASITTTSGSWTATRNCWCSGTLKVAQGSAAIVYYDGYTIAEVNGANDTEITATFPVKQGTVITTRNVGVYNLKFY